MKLSKSARHLAIGVVASCTIVSNAAAQGGLEEVIVTARRVEESLQDIPISISAVTGQDIQAMGIQDTNDVGQYMPNLTLETTARNNNTNIFIRGVGGGNPNAASIQAGVGIYTDGIYMPRIEGGFMSTLDIERIEVLRGPQGTLFGKNTTGGAVNIVTVKPGPELSRSLTLRVGDYNRREMRGTLNVPLADNLYARVTGLAERRDGFYTETITGQDWGNRRRYAGRAALRYVPSDDFTLDVSATYANQPERPTGATCVWAFPGSLAARDVQPRHEAATGEVFRDFCTGSRETAADRTFASDLDPFSDTELYSAVVQASWTPEANGFFDTREIKLIAGLSGQEQGFVVENDFTELRMDFVSRDKIEADQSSFEVQFNASNDQLSLTSGIFWADDVMREGGNNCRDEIESVDLAAGESTTCLNAGLFKFHQPGIRPIVGTSIYGKIETMALYGNLTYNVTDAFAVTVGARQTWEDREFERLQFFGIQTDVDTTITPISQQSVLLNLRGSGDWSELTPTLSLSYALPGGGVLDSGNLYFTYANGFQSGGLNTELSAAEIGPLLFYEPEIVDSYEIGLKSTWADGRVRLNLAYYDVEYSDKQVEIPVDPTLFASGDPNTTVIINAARQVADGVELELTLAPTDALFINLNYGTLNTEYEEFLAFDPNVQMVTNQTDRIPSQLVPKRTGGLRVSYDFDLGNRGTVTPMLIGSLRGDLERYDAARSTDPRSEIFQEAYTKWDARLSWANAAETMTVTGFILNVTDEDYLTGGSSFQDSNRGWYNLVLGPPKMWGVELNMSF